MKPGFISFLVVILLSFNVGVNAAGALQLEDTKVEFSLPQGWTMGEVAAIKHLPNGHVVVFHRGQHQLLEFDQNHHFVREIGHGLFAKPHGLRVDSKGNIWTTDAGNHLVLRFAPSGKVTMVLGKKDEAGKGWFDRDYNVVFFNQPQDVGFDSKDNIYVVDKGNARIVKLNPDGNLIKTWGKKGSQPGEFNFVHSIVIDQQDRLYVADRENKRIQKFDADGKFLGLFDNIGYPYFLALSNNAHSQATLWMTDARFEKVLNLDLNGKIIASYQGKMGRNPGQFSAVHGIDVDADGNVWVSQIFNWGGINKLKL